MVPGCDRVGIRALVVGIYSQPNWLTAIIALISYVAVGMVVPYARHRQLTAKIQAADRLKAANQQYLLEPVRGMAVVRQLGIAKQRMTKGNEGFDQEATAFQQTQFSQLLKMWRQPL